MNSTSLLEWIKALGSILVSWPVVGLVAIIIFRKSLLKISNQLATPGITRAKFGPVEIEKLNNLSEKIDDQKIEQEKQKSEIETLRFLISNFVTEAELGHLKALSIHEPFFYEKAPYFEIELRRLRSLGLIDNFSNKGIRSMPK